MSFTANNWLETLCTPSDPFVINKQLRLMDNGGKTTTAFKTNSIKSASVKLTYLSLKKQFVLNWLIRI